MNIGNVTKCRFLEKRKCINVENIGFFVAVVFPINNTGKFRKSNFIVESASQAWRRHRCLVL